MGFDNARWRGSFICHIRSYNVAKDLSKLRGMILSGEVVVVDTDEGKSFIKPATQ